MLQRHRIFTVLLNFAQRHNGATPTQRHLWTLHQKAAGHSMAWGVFQRHLEGLEKDQLIRRDQGFIVIVKANWQPGEFSLKPNRQKKSRRSYRG